MQYSIIENGFVSVPVYEDDYSSMIHPQFENYETVGKFFESQSNVTVTKADIKIYFYNKNTSELVLNISSIDEIKKSGYSSSKNTVFVIHGWHNSYHSSMCQVVKDAYLTVTDVNIFVVDWNSIAKQEYFQARNQVVQTGKVIAELIYSMVTNGLLHLNKTSIVGHSLGAHVAGTTGKALKGQVDHIVGKYFVYDS